MFLQLKDIHNYLENRNEIGKVQSIYSLIQVAEQINKEKLDIFTLNVIYEEIPDGYKEQLILPFISIEESIIVIIWIFSGNLSDIDKSKYPFIDTIW